MVPAMIALISGGLLARYVLWPFELQQEERALQRDKIRLAELEREIKETL